MALGRGPGGRVLLVALAKVRSSHGHSGSCGVGRSGALGGRRPKQLGRSAAVSGCGLRGRRLRLELRAGHCQHPRHSGGRRGWRPGRDLDGGGAGHTPRRNRGCGGRASGAALPPPSRRGIAELAGPGTMPGGRAAGAGGGLRSRTSDVADSLLGAGSVLGGRLASGPGSRGRGVGDFRRAAAAGGGDASVGRGRGWRGDSVSGGARRK